MISKEKKQAIMKEYARCEGDTGSPEVQVAVRDSECRFPVARSFRDNVPTSHDTVSYTGSLPQT